MMTLDEAILHCEEVVDRCATTDGNRKCEIEHRQLAEWLRELKERRTFDTDTISRQAAVIQLSHNKIGDDDCDVIIQRDIETIKQLPSEEPDIIYCKDCRKHNKRIGDYVEKSDGTYDWIWKDQACPLAEFRGKAQGHEFDYQFCAYAERRTGWMT